MNRDLRHISVFIPFLAPVILFLQGTLPVLAAEGLDPDHTYSVTAVAEANVINLNWSTPSEVNSDYFIVQRSKDGILFDDVMQELAAGNSLSVSNYSVTDYRPHPGTSFYRVVEVDVDGNLTRTVSTVVNFEMELSITVSSASSGKTFNVAITNQKQKQVLLVVQDIQGTEFYSKVILLRSADELVAIEPEGKLPPGLYTVIASSSNSACSKKIIITR